VPAPKPNLSSSIWLIVAGLVVIAALGLFSNGGGGGSDVIPYSQFQQLLDANKVKQVTVSGSALHGTLTDAMPDGKTSFTTVSDSGPLGTLLSWVLPPLLFVGIRMFASRAMMGGRGGGFGGRLLSVGRSKAKLATETDVKVTRARVRRDSIE
jgi:cell division protease FtsH